MRMKIIWITTARQPYGPKVIQGGMTYDYLAIQSLRRSHDIEIAYIRKDQHCNIIRRFASEYTFFRRLHQLRLDCDLTIRTHFPIAHVPYEKSTKNIAILHQFHKGLTFDGYYIPFFFYNLRNLDAVVTVSQYWRSWFLQKGCKNVHVIYNPFNLDEFVFNEDEIVAFKRKLNLIDRDPIIYIGAIGKGKGVEKTYRVLEDLNATLVCSGNISKNDRIPCLHLDRREYLYLLKSSQIAIQMSELNEGWCRVLHEAMLCQVPVVGSGRGGMTELLSGGGQIICRDFKNLKRHVIRLLENRNLRKDMGARGFNFAKKFSYERFKKDWTQLIDGVK
jgi:glycosyltransferase involved in cell wall biosynthesis